MTQLLRHFILGMAVFASGAVMADVTFFESENFGGRELTINQPLSSFSSSRFNDRARSAIVEGGSWEVCIDDNFGGGCTVLAPGRYPALGDVSGRISSARPIRTPPVAALAPIGGVTFFESEGFGGRQFVVDQPVANFAAARFNDRAQSAIVEGGTWEICVDADYRGECLIFAPGRYPNLGGIGGQVSSARPSREPRGDRRDRMGGRARATLFEGPNLTGRAFLLGREGAANLEGTFNDRASSLRVDSGYWIFCSDANFRGECRTFGPGEYAVLPPGLNNRISSGRRISNDYPYSGAPNWR